MDNNFFKDKVVFVTGSSRGIGKAIALKFATLGAKVVINSSNSKEQLTQTLTELKKITPNAIALIGDVSDYSQCETMFTNIKNKFGDVDILVNNAGIAHIGLFTDMKPSEWQRILDVNLNSAINCSHLAIPSMVHKKSGSIINISSMWGNVGASCEVIYSASKGAINMFTRALGKELAPSNIRVNAIACGVVDTDMNNCLSVEDKSALKEEIPLMRFATPEEIANTVVYLSSPEASYLTSQIITLDGGMN